MWMSHTCTFGKWTAGGIVSSILRTLRGVNLFHWTFNSDVVQYSFFVVSLFRQLNAQYFFSIFLNLLKTTSYLFILQCNIITKELNCTVRSKCDLQEWLECCCFKSFFCHNTLFKKFNFQMTGIFKITILFLIWPKQLNMFSVYYDNIHVSRWSECFNSKD